MPARDSRPTWVVVAAILIVVALIAAVLGATISSLTSNDDDPAAQASPGVTPTPGASPTPFGKDFVSETSTSADPTDAEALDRALSARGDRAR